MPINFYLRRKKSDLIKRIWYEFFTEISLHRLNVSSHPVQPDNEGRYVRMGRDAQPGGQHHPPPTRHTGGHQRPAGITVIIQKIAVHQRPADDASKPFAENNFFFVEFIFVTLFHFWKRG